MVDPPDSVAPQMRQVHELLRQRQAEPARALLREVLAQSPGAVGAWMQLALVCRMLKDPEGELEAVRGALSANPYDLFALLVRGDCLERAGQAEEALRAQRAACTVAEQSDVEALGPEVQRMLQHARVAVNRSHARLGHALDELLRSEGSELNGLAQQRFHLAVDLLLGRRQRFDPQPMGLYYPSLLQCEFFPRERFPWLADLEAQTEAIRQEFLAVLAQDSGFEPYLLYERDQPLAQWAELNRNLAWSAFHLIKDGHPIPLNAERCPQTLRTLARMPQPRQHGRTPVAMFSCLKPGTRIPPHVGVSNARLLVHLPLIVPPRCGFRVGSQTRAWRVGEALVFDDSVEHEAWNLSEELRVVLIFDVWHPDLSQEEQRLLDLLSAVQSRSIAAG